MENKRTNPSFKCGETGCEREFQENDILYQCEECGEYYCYTCYCRNHYEQHTEWLSFKIINGELTEL